MLFCILTNIGDLGELSNFGVYNFVCEGSIEMIVSEMAVSELMVAGKCRTPEYNSLYSGVRYLWAFACYMNFSR